MSDSYKLDYSHGYTKFNKAFFENVVSKINTSIQMSGKTVNLEWFDFIYSIVPYINNIFESAKTFLKEEEEIIKIEKVRKVSVATIKHLSKHTNFVKKFDPVKRKVIPEKLLNAYKEDTYNTYENRFICTLVDDIDVFLFDIENQLKKISLNTLNLMVLNSQSEVKEEKLSFDCKMEASSESHSSYEEFVKKSEELRKFVSNWRETFLYKRFISERMAKVSPPLNRTNVILKNPNFQQAARLWDFIHGFQLDLTNLQDDITNFDQVNENFDIYLKSVFLSLYYLTMSNNASDEHIRNYYLDAYDSVVVDSFRFYIRDTFKRNANSHNFLINIINNEYKSFKKEKVADPDFVVEEINSKTLSYLDKINSTFFAVDHSGTELLYDETDDPNIANSKDVFYKSGANNIDTGQEEDSKTDSADANQEGSDDNESSDVSQDGNEVDSSDTSSEENKTDSSDISSDGNKTEDSDTSLENSKTEDSDTNSKDNEDDNSDTNSEDNKREVSDNNLEDEDNSSINLDDSEAEVSDTSLEDSSESAYNSQDNKDS